MALRVLKNHQQQHCLSVFSAFFLNISKLLHRCWVVVEVKFAILLALHATQISSSSMNKIIFEIKQTNKTTKKENLLFEC